MNTPCISLCTLGAGGSKCKGCNRTVKQCAQWNGYSDYRRTEESVMVLDEKHKEILILVRKGVIKPSQYMRALHELTEG